MWMLDVELTAVVRQEEQGEESEKHVEKCSPFCYLVQNGIIGHADVLDLRGELECDSKHLKGNFAWGYIVVLSGIRGLLYYEIQVKLSVFFRRKTVKVVWVDCSLDDRECDCDSLVDSGHQEKIGDQKSIGVAVPFFLCSGVEGVFDEQENPPLRALFSDLLLTGAVKGRIIDITHRNRQFGVVALVSGVKKP